MNGHLCTLLYQLQAAPSQKLRPRLTHHQLSNPIFRLSLGSSTCITSQVSGSLSFQWQCRQQYTKFQSGKAGLNSLQTPSLRKWETKSNSTSSRPWAIPLSKGTTKTLVSR